MSSERVQACNRYVHSHPEEEVRFTVHYYGADAARLQVYRGDGKPWRDWLRLLAPGESVETEDKTCEEVLSQFGLSFSDVAHIYAD
jgi:hypothetical protein